MVPLSRGRMSSSAASAPCTWPRYVVSVTRRTSAAASSETGENTVVIALLIHTSIWPSRDSISWAASCTSCHSPTSAWTATARPPCARTSSAAARRPCSPRLIMPTSYPRCARRTAVALPTPAEAPVTTATRRRVARSVCSTDLASSSATRHIPLRVTRQTPTRRPTSTRVALLSSPLRHNGVLRVLGRGDAGVEHAEPRAHRRADQCSAGASVPQPVAATDPRRDRADHSQHLPGLQPLAGRPVLIRLTDHSEATLHQLRRRRLQDPPEGCHTSGDACLIEGSIDQTHAAGSHGCGPNEHKWKLAIGVVPRWDSGVAEQRGGVRSDERREARCGNCTGCRQPPESGSDNADRRQRRRRSETREQPGTHAHRRGGFEDAQHVDEP